MEKLVVMRVCVNDTDREPRLSPRGYVGDTTMVKNPLAASSTSIVETTIWALSKNTHTDIAESSAEHGAMALYMQSPPTIFVLMAVYVSKYFFLVFFREYLVQMSCYV